MSAKNLDRHNRWRSKTIAFRMSPQEADILDSNVRLSGLTKQDYLCARALQQQITVVGNPRVYKALRNELAAVLDELKRIEAGAAVHDDLLDRIDQINTTLYGMKGERMAYKTEKTVPKISVGADKEQPSQKYTANIITESSSNFNSFEEIRKRR